MVINLQIYKSVLITSPTGFDIAFTNVEDTLKKSQDKVVSILFQRCFNVGHRRCINLVKRWKSDVGLCFSFNVWSTLFQRWSTTLIRRCNVRWEELIMKIMFVKWSFTSLLTKQTRFTFSGTAKRATRKFVDTISFH